MKLAYSPGPASNLATRDFAADWERIAERLTHKTGQKDGSCLVRGACAPERRDTNLHASELLVLDADHGLDFDTGEEVAAPHPCLAAEALDGYQYIITTSYSHRPDAPRWRLWMPTDAPFTRDQCHGITRALHARLLVSGVPVARSPESWRWSQAWFLPRHPADVQPLRYAGDGEPVCAADLLAEAPAPEPEPELAAVPLPGGRIDSFNQAHDLDAMLLAAGYQFRGRRKLGDGTAAMAYLHPRSETGIPGTFAFSSRTGKPVVLSFATNDPLFAERDGRPLYLDAYDVAAKLCP